MSRINTINPVCITLYEILRKGRRNNMRQSMVKSIVNECLIDITKWLIWAGDTRRSISARRISVVMIIIYISDCFFNVQGGNLFGQFWQPGDNLPDKSLLYHPRNCLTPRVDLDFFVNLLQVIANGSLRNMYYWSNFMIRFPLNEQL